MGRRAKNKQGDPRPLPEFQEKGNRRDSSRKSGKRKAEAPEEDALSKRPAKKLKEAEGKKVTTKTKNVSFAKEKNSDNGNKSAPVKDKKGKRKQESEDEDEDELVEDDGDSEGWEDVDEDEVKDQRKYV